MLFLFVLVPLIGAWYIILRRHAAHVLPSSVEIVAAAIPAGFVGFAAITSVLGIIVSTGIAAALAVCITVGISIPALRALLRGKDPLIIFPQGTRGEMFVRYGALFLFWCVIALLVANSFAVRPDGSWSFSSGAIVDAPYHLAQIIRTALVPHLDFGEPNFAGEFIRYPFFINLLSGVLLKAGASLSFAYHIPLFLLLFSVLVLAAQFFRSLGAKNGIIFCAVGIVLFGAGVGYIAYVQSGGAFTIPIRRGVPFPMQNIAYPAMVPGFLVVQRPFFLGFPLFILTLLFFFSGIRTKRLADFLAAGIIAGLLPFAHVHSFIASMTVVLSAIAYLAVFRNPLFFEAVRGFVIPSFLLTIPQLSALLFLPKYPDGSFFSVRLGWMSNPAEVLGLVLPWDGAPRFMPWLRYVGTNFGLLLLLPLFAAGNFMRLRSNTLLGMALFGTVAAWILPNIFQFQVWDFDSNKLFAFAIFCSVAVAVISTGGLSGTVRKLALSAFLVIVVGTVPAAGIVAVRTLTHSAYNRVDVFGADEQAAAAWVRENTQTDAAFISSASLIDPETVQNPVVVGSGRLATAGFLTWLYTHGIDYSDRVEAIERFFSDPANAKIILADFPADYLVIDERLRKKYPALETMLTGAGSETAFSQGTIAIVRLK